MGEPLRVQVMAGGGWSDEAGNIAREAGRAGLQDVVIFQTSGSSGRPRWAVLTERSLEVSARAVNSRLRAGAGDRIREGLQTVILGPPNAGKSTLFNRLCGSDRAIVSPQPGTTRDVIDAEIEIAGVRIVLQDTAGLRVGGGAVEAEGHRRARGAAAAADLAIFLWPADAEETEPPLDVLAGLEVIRVRSKADLGVSHKTKAEWLAVSGITGQGFEELRTKIAAVAETEIVDLGGSVAIGCRHRAALDRALREIQGCEVSRPELAAERVRWSVRAIEEMIGAVDTEEVLDEVFSTFCIGK